MSWQCSRGGGSGSGGGNSLLDKHDRAASVLFPLRVRLVRQHAGLVLLDFGREVLDETLDDGEFVGVRGEDGDDVDF